jgi:hypothetical protein
MPIPKDIANAGTSVDAQISAPNIRLEGKIPARLVKVGSLKPSQTTAFHRPEVSKEEIDAHVGAGLTGLSDYGGAVTNRHLLLKHHLKQAKEKGFFRGIVDWMDGTRGTPLEASVRLKRGNRAKITLTGFGAEASATALRAPEINKFKAAIAKFLGLFTSRFDDWRKEVQVREGYKKIGEDLRTQFRDHVREEVTASGTSLEDGQLEGFIKTLYRLEPKDAKELIRAKVEEILPHSMRTPGFLTRLEEGLFYDPEIADARNEGYKISLHLAAQIYAGVVDGVFEGHRNLVSALLADNKVTDADALHQNLSQAIEANFTLITKESGDVLNASTLQPKIDGVRTVLTTLRADLSDPAKTSALGEERREDLIKVVDSRLADLAKIETSNKAVLKIVGTPDDPPTAKTLYGVSARLADAVRDPIASGLTSEKKIKDFYIKAQQDLKGLKETLTSGLSEKRRLLPPNHLTVEQWTATRDLLETATAGLLNGAEFVIEEAAIRGEFASANIRSADASALRDKIAAFNLRFDPDSPGAVLSAIPATDHLLRAGVHSRISRLGAGAFALDSFLKSQSDVVQLKRKYREEVAADPAKLPEFVGKAEGLVIAHQADLNLRKTLVEEFGVPASALTEPDELVGAVRRDVVRAALGLPEAEGEIGPDAPLLDLLASKVRLTTDMVLPLRNRVAGERDPMNQMTVHSDGERFLADLYRVISNTDPVTCSTELTRIADGIYDADRQAALDFKLALLGGEGKADARLLVERAHVLKDSGTRLERALGNTALVRGLTDATGVRVTDLPSLLRAVQNLHPAGGADFRRIGEVLALHARAVDGGVAALADVPEERIREIALVSEAVADLATHPGKFDAAKATLLLSRVVNALAPGETDLGSEVLKQGVADGLHVAPALRKEIEELNALQKRCVEKLNLNLQARSIVERNFEAAGDRLAEAIGLSSGDVTALFLENREFNDAVTHYVLYNGYKEELLGPATPAENPPAVGEAAEEPAAEPAVSARALRNRINLPAEVLAESSRSAAGNIGRFDPVKGTAASATIFDKLGRYFTRKGRLEAKDQAQFYDPKLAALYADVIREKRVLNAISGAHRQYEEIISGFSEEATAIEGKARQITYQRLLTAAVIESWKGSGLPAGKFLIDSERRGAIVARLREFGVTVDEFPGLEKELGEATQAAQAGSLDGWIGEKITHYTEENSEIELRHAALEQQLVLLTEDLIRIESEARRAAPNLPTVWTAIRAADLPHFLHPSATWVKASGIDPSDLKNASFGSGIELAYRALSFGPVRQSTQTQSLKELLTRLQELDQDIKVELERRSIGADNVWTEHQLLARRDHVLAGIQRHPGFAFQKGHEVQRSVLSRLNDDISSIDLLLGERISLLVDPQNRQEFLERISSGRKEALANAPLELPSTLRVGEGHIPLPEENPAVGNLNDGEGTDPARDPALSIPAPFRDGGIAELLRAHPDFNLRDGGPGPITSFV